MSDADALRIGLAFARLLAAKRERGADVMVHTSWTSDQPLIVALVRRHGRAPLGRPFVGVDAAETLEKAADHAESEES